MFVIALIAAPRLVEFYADLCRVFGGVVYLCGKDKLDV